MPTSAQKKVSGAHTKLRHHDSGWPCRHRPTIFSSKVPTSAQETTRQLTRNSDITIQNGHVDIDLTYDIHQQSTDQRTRMYQVADKKLSHHDSGWPCGHRSTYDILIVPMRRCFLYLIPNSLRCPDRATCSMISPYNLVFALRLLHTSRSRVPSLLPSSAYIGPGQR